MPNWLDQIFRRKTSNDKTKKKTEPKQKPIDTKPRYPCPFYGFCASVETGVLADQEGDQCALITSNRTPCHMRLPSLDRCPRASRQSDQIDQIFERYQVFPKELWPIGQKKWAGLSFHDWKKRIMQANHPRPKAK